MLDAVRHWYFGLTSAEQISAVVALFAGASLVVATLAYRRSGKAYKLAKKQEERNAARLKLGYDGSTSSDVGDDRQYVFRVSISNQSDSPTSVTRVGLDLTYEREQRLYVLPLDATELRLVDGTKLPIPFDLAPRGSRGGDVRFAVPLAVIAKVTVRGHTLRVTDSHDNMYERSVPHIVGGR